MPLCLINFAFHAHPSFPFIIAANRDEFYHRPTAEADYWIDYPFLLGGKDLEKGGMWLGITKSGRFAALTNFREILGLPIDIRSRGELVKDFLISEEEPIEYLERLERVQHEYPGFNLILGDMNDLYFFSNRSEGIVKIESGTYSLCNGSFHCSWPKVEKGKQMLEKSLNIETREDLQHYLFYHLKDSVVAPDDLLPDTGVGQKLERFLSSMFIKGDDYGTRSSTVIIGNPQGIYFTEKTYFNNNNHESDRSYYIPL